MEYYVLFTRLGALMAIFISDLTRSKEEILVDLINHDNETNYQVSDFMFDYPAPIAAIGRNTEITLTGVVPKKVYGETTLTYKRPDISALPGQERLVVWVEGKTYTRDLIVDINRTLGINLQEHDFVDVKLPTFDELPKGTLATVDLVMTADNPIYVGTLPVRIFN